MDKCILLVSLTLWEDPHCVKFLNLLDIAKRSSSVIYMELNKISYQVKLTP